jgi:hypothetical protein
MVDSPEKDGDETENSKTPCSVLLYQRVYHLLYSDIVGSKELSVLEEIHDG